MIKLYPKAVVLTNSHPFGGTEMMARSLAAALLANGYEAHVVNINDAHLNRHLPILQDPEVELMITTGTLPLALAIDQIPLWRAVPADTDFITYIIDAWPYDYVRVPSCRDFLRDWAQMPNLHVASLERNDSLLIGDRAHYFPTGAYAAPRRRGPKAHPDRLMIWGSANKELAVTRFHDGFEQTISDNNPWGLDARRIATISESLRHTTIVHGLSAMAHAFNEPIQSLVRPDAVVALCAIDSCLKRYRRVKVARALRGMPVDFYGENWEQHVGDTPSFRFCKPDPDHNHAFSHVCQHYAGLVNFDPNFGHGTNERAVSALAMGIPIANNFNVRTDNAVGCFPYHFSDESIRFAAQQLLAFEGTVAMDARHTWEYLIRQLLGEIARSRSSAARPALANQASVLRI
jgi:hypothetical protein